MIVNSKNPLFTEVTTEESGLVCGGIQLLIDSVNREVRINNADGRGNAAVIYKDSNSVSNNQSSVPYSEFGFPTSI